MDAQEIVERIMTDHWDLAACPCWVCQAGRALGFGAREEYLPHRNGNSAKYPIPSGYPNESWVAKKD